jgi:hypothetical protein
MLKLLICYIDGKNAVRGQEYRSPVAGIDMVQSQWPNLTNKECRGLHFEAKRASDAGEASGAVSMEQHMDQ